MRSYTETYTYRELTEKPKVEKPRGETQRETEMERSPEKNTGPEKLCGTKNEERDLNI